MFEGREPPGDREEGAKSAEPPTPQKQDLSDVQRNAAFEMDVTNDVEGVMTETSNPEPQELYLEQHFRDHFTFSTPSTLVRFRSNHAVARVFEHNTTQFILEETIDEASQRRRIHVKQLSDGTTGLHFLRLLYTVMAVFWAGIFFVMCLQILLVMVLEMAIYGGTTEVNTEWKGGQFIGIVLGILVFSYAFSQGLVIAGAFVQDAWTGHYLVKLFFFRNRCGNVIVDWIFFCFFVLFPIWVMCITLLLRREDWWSITLLFWYACVSVFFVIFATSSVYFEIRGALSFLSKREDMAGVHFWSLVKECVLLRQRSAYSGYKTYRYVARSGNLRIENGISILEDSVLEWSKEETTGPWSRITKLEFLSTAASEARRCAVPFFSPVEPPQHLYTIDDVQNYRPYVTKYTWSLERWFCRPRNSRYIVIIRGPGAVTGHQMKSSLVCSIIGLLVCFLIIISFLFYMEFTALVIFGLVVAVAIASIPLLKDLRRLVRVTKKVFRARNEERQTEHDNDGTSHDPSTGQNRSRRGSEIIPELRNYSRRDSEILSDEPNEGLLLVVQQARVTQASEPLCWTATVVEILLFFFYPLVVLFQIRNFQLASLFLFSATVSLIRHYVNLLAVVEETGQLNLVSGATAKIRWSKQSRLNDLIEAISYNKTRRFWQLILAGCGIFGVLIVLSTSGASFEPTSENTLTFVNGFAWTPQPDDVRYGACNLTKISAFGPNSTLSDYAFLAGLPYKKAYVAEPLLREWFNTTTEVREDSGTVAEFRERNGFENSPVYFRLYRFKLENGKDRGVISIRGTQNSWDILADFQLWIAAMLAQGLRAILPIGGMWTPILDQIVGMISFFQRGTVDDVSFYKVTTRFAIELKNDPSFDSIQITGHSLGGGLAMISSAQSQVPSVALSGPNAMISGRSFEPKVDPDQLNRYTFNIVPDRDPVPRFDDLANNYQRIRCTAAPNRLLHCHSYTRSLCEIVYTCGSQGRPAICDCVYEYNYPVPDSLTVSPGQQSFEQACQDNGYFS